MFLLVTLLLASLPGSLLPLWVWYYAHLPPGGQAFVPSSTIPAWSSFLSKPPLAPTPKRACHLICLLMGLGVPSLSSVSPACRTSESSGDASKNSKAESQDFDNKMWTRGDSVL